MTEPDLSVVVPTYNEATIIIATLEEIAAHLQRLALRGEIRDGKSVCALLRAPHFLEG